MNETETRIFKAQGDDIDALRPKGLLNAEAFPVERSIAFSIDGTHKFGDSKREKDEESSSHTLVIALTSSLKGFLSETLWNTNRTGGYGNNPQFKPEHGKYNIIIPETGWKAFWSIARESAEVQHNKS
jgi:hypothetical protein